MIKVKEHDDTYAYYLRSEINIVNTKYTFISIVKFIK